MSTVKGFKMRETSSGETATIRPPLAGIIDLLRCPVSAQPLVQDVRLITRASIMLDRWTVSLPPLRHAGLQVIGVAVKPKDSLE